MKKIYSQNKITSNGMKKFLPYILILVVMIGVLSPMTKINAAQGDICAISIDGTVVDGTRDANNKCVPNSNPTIIPVNDGLPAQESGGCGVSLNPARWFLCLITSVAYLIFKITALIMGMAGVLLNFVIKTTIVDMSVNVAKMTGINIAWKVIRDLMNITFVFLLMYEGVRMIIGESDVAKVRKFITGIVLASLLINFSLFFTKVIIDASNIVTIGVYDSIIADTQGTGGTLCSTCTGLSNSIQQSLGLQGAFSPIAIQNAGDPYVQLMANLMVSALFLVLSFVFFAVSVLLVVRYIVLIFLLVLAPIAFMGMAGLPGMKKHSDEWWETLWGQIFFAPIFMIMMWVVLILITSDGFTGVKLDNTKWAKLGSTNNLTDVTSSISLLFNYVLIIGLSILALVTSKKFASKGAEQVSQFTGKATAFAGGAILGGAAGLGRNTIGRAANAAASSDRLKNFAFKKDEKGNLVARTGLGAIAARGALRGAQGTAKSGFDVRQTGGFGLLEDAGVKFGKGTQGIPFLGNAKAGEGGFKKKVEEKAKTDKAYMESLKPSEDEEAKYKADATTRMASDGFREEEKDRRDKHFNEETVIKEIEAEKAKLEEAAAKAKAEKEEADRALKAKKELLGAEEAKLKESVDESEAKLKKLEEDLKKAQSDFNLGFRSPADAARVQMAQEAFDTEQKAKASLDEKLKNERIQLKDKLKEQLKDEQNTLDEKVAMNEKANKAIEENKKKVANDKAGGWKSDEFARLGLIAEGKRTLYQDRGEALAKTFDDRAGKKWRDTTVNKARAKAVRDAVKGKSIEQQMADYVKAIDKKRRESGETSLLDEDKPAETPAPVTPPTPTPTITLDI